MLVFWSIAALAWLLLLLVLLKPLFRRQGTNQPHKPASYKRRLLVSVATAAFIVVSSASLYVYWSNGYSLLIAPSYEESDIVQLTEQLAQRLEQSPDDPQGWLLLATSYTALEEHDKAVTAYQQAERYTEQLAQRLEQSPDDPQGWLLLATSYTALEEHDKAVTAYQQAERYAELEAWAQIAYAQALLVADGSLNAKAKDLLEVAVASSPDNTRGLFLIGLAYLERANYLQTISYWEHLLTLLEAGDPLANAVEEKLIEVRTLATEMPDTSQDEPRQDTSDKQAEDSEATQTTSEEAACFIRVNVTMDAELPSQISPQDTLFVYAKATTGPPMPLAIKQFTADVLPLETCLGPEDAMIEGMTINSFDSIQIIARISKSGLAAPQPGDIQALSEPLSTKNGSVVSLSIDEILE